MRYRGAHHLPEWLEQGASILMDNRKEDITPVLTSVEGPICVEVGCGKGGFIHQMSETYPDYFFVGIDKVTVIAAKAAANAVEKGLSNLFFVIGDVEYIAAKFEPNRVHRIFLNFSDPWPRRRHAERRLTAEQKLRLYEKLLEPGGCVEQKTDNRDFFEWSIQSFKEAGWTLAVVERGFEADKPTDELSSKYVQTEYEAKFRGRGVPINYLRAYPPERANGEA